MLNDNDRRKKNNPYLEMSPDNDQKKAYVSNSSQLQTHSLTFIVKRYSLRSAIRMLPHSSIGYNTTAFLDRSTCIDYVDFGKQQDRLILLSWSKNDPKYLDVNFKVFKRDDNKNF